MTNDCRCYRAARCNLTMCRARPSLLVLPGVCWVPTFFFRYLALFEGVHEVFYFARRYRGANVARAALLTLRLAGPFDFSGKPARVTFKSRHLSPHYESRIQILRARMFDPVGCRRCAS